MPQRQERNPTTALRDLPSDVTAAPSLFPHPRRAMRRSSRLGDEDARDEGRWEMQYGWLADQRTPWIRTASWGASDPPRACRGWR